MVTALLGADSTCAADAAAMAATRGAIGENSAAAATPARAMMASARTRRFCSEIGSNSTGATGFLDFPTVPTSCRYRTGFACDVWARAAGRIVQPLKRRHG